MITSSRCKSLALSLSFSLSSLYKELLVRVLAFTLYIIANALLTRLYTFVFATYNNSPSAAFYYFAAR